MAEHGELVLPGDASGKDEPDSLLVMGNATLLLRCGGITVLTDPSFVHRHESVDLGYGLSTTRLLDPAVELDDLPPIDVVLLSHLHGDHFDQVAQERLDRDLPILTTPQSARDLQDMGFMAARGLDTWESVTVRRGGCRLTVTSAPGRHGPLGVDLVLPDVMGSVLEWTSGTTQRRLYVTGDTLAIDELAEIPRRHPNLDVGVFHLGGTKVLGILVSMDAEQGVAAMHAVRPTVVVPVHHEDYDVFTSGLDEFLEEAARAGLSERVVVVGRGERALVDDVVHSRSGLQAPDTFASE